MNYNKISPEGSILLAFTALAHLYATPFAPSPLYQVIIRMNTFLRFLWHLSNTPPFSTLGVLHHASTTLWFATDTYLSSQTIYVHQIMFLNLSMEIARWSLPWIEQKGGIPYSVSHSIWHLVSAAKAIYVAVCLNSLQGMHEVIE